MKFETGGIRQQNILMHDLENLDQDFTFYYDETNNIGKLHIREGSFNQLFSNQFILGGLVFTSSEPTSDEIGTFIDSLNLQSSAKELKFKHIAKGSFEDCLKSKRLGSFLNWLDGKDVFIHYSHINLLFYSLVDILDSIVGELELLESIGLEFLFFLKSTFYDIAKDNLDEIVDVFYDFNYPNISEGKGKDFIDELMQIVAPFTKAESMDYPFANDLNVVFSKVKKDTHLPFVMNEENHLLVKSSDLMQVYARPIYMFLNSEHIFDNENSMKSLLNKYDLDSDGVILKNYKFVDSKDERLVQLSDVIVGLLGKLFDFLDNINKDELLRFVEKLNSVQLKNLKLLMKFLQEAEIENKAFIFSFASMTERLKYQTLHEIVFNYRLIIG